MPCARGARTVENEKFQTFEFGDGRCHLSHHVGIYVMAIKVQKHDAAPGFILQHAHELAQLIPRELPKAFSMQSCEVPCELPTRFAEYFVDIITQVNLELALLTYFQLKAKDVFKG